MCGLQGGDAWKQRAQFVGHEVKNQNSHRDICLVLLVRQVPVDRDEGVETLAGQRQQLPVLDAGPPLSHDGRHLVPRQRPPQARGHAPVKQQAHQRPGARERPRERPPHVPGKH